MTNAPSNGRLLGWLYGEPLLRRRLANTHPGEQPVYTTGAMLVPKDDQDDEVQRITRRARRGAFAVTRERLVFLTSLWMPLNVLFMAIASVSVVFWLRGGGFPAVMLAAFGVAWVIQRRPYRLELPIDEVERVTIKAVDGATGGYHTLIVHTAEAAYQIVTTDAMDADTRAFLATLM